MPVNMIDPWFEIEDAMDLLSSRSRRSGLAFSRAAASVFQNDFPSLSRRKQKPTRLQAKSTESDMTDTKVADYDELKRKLRNCQDEIFKLQAANSDLTQVNKRWHKYNADMQIFIDKLQSTIRDQQEQINNIGEDKYYFNTRKEINISEECDQIKCRRLKEEIAKLREEVEHLKFQVRAHKDDWEAEKLEKQEALNERDALQSRLNDVLRDICNLNRCPNEESRRRPQGCPCCKHWDRSNPDYSIASPGFNQTVICSSSRQSPHHQGRYFFTDENIECDTSKQNSATKLNCNNLLSESDERDNPRSRRLSLTSDDRALEDTACSLRPREESYSTTTTLPSSSIVDSRADSPITLPPSPRPQQATTLAMGIKTGNGATLTSYVRLPVVKSYSAPEGESLAAGPSSNVRLNSISLSLVPAAAGSSAGAAGGASSVTATSTLVQHSASSSTPPTTSSSHHLPPPPRSLPSLVNSSNDDLIACPKCHQVFTSGTYLEFIDHFDQCQRDRD